MYVRVFFNQEVKSMLIFILQCTISREFSMAHHRITCPYKYRSSSKTIILLLLRSGGIINCSSKWKTDNQSPIKSC